MVRLALKIILPVLVVALGIYAAWYMIETAPKAGRQRRPAPPPAVRVQKAAKTDVQLTVSAQGVVQPRTETQLVAEVPGKVVYLSPAMAAGGFFEKNAVLFKLDPHDYEIAVVQAEGSLAQAKLDLSLIQAEAEAASEEWQKLDRGEASPLVLKVPQVAEAEATLRSVEAALEQAKLNLTRTVVRAPYDGRVRKEYADLGQYVAKGFTLAEIYAVDFAEVRLPLADDKLAYLDLPLDYRNGHKNQEHPKVLIKANFGGREFAWEGEVVRTEGELDPRSRMVIAVAQVENPYGRGDDPGRPPLASGMFVEAEILGKLAKDVVVLPRGALRGRDQVLVVSSDDRLSFRQVQVLQLGREQVVISQGIEDGETVCITQPEAVVEGMPVRVLGKSPQGSQKKSKGPGSGKPDRPGAAGHE